MLPVAALLDAFPEGPPQSVRVLDAAAAPGGKTTALAAWAAKVGGGVVANEPNAFRRKALVDNLLRTGTMPWTAITQIDARNAGKWWPEEFDAVLLDAPCSGESLSNKGVRDAWDHPESQLEYSSHLQRNLAASAVRALKVGGVMVYSTCTFNPKENENVLAFLQKTYGDAIEVESLDDLAGAERLATPEGYLRCWPHLHDVQGFFVARLRKKHSTGNEKAVVKGRKRRRAHQIEDWRGKDKWNRVFDNAGEDTQRVPVGGTYFRKGDTAGNMGKRMEPVNKKEAKRVRKAFMDTFGAFPGDDEPGLVLRRQSSEIWLCSDALSGLDATGLRRNGIRLAEMRAYNLAYPAHWEWTLSFAHRLPENGIGVALLNKQQAQQFCEGQNAQPDWTEASAMAKDGMQAVARCGQFVIGIGRWFGGQLRNDTPRHWRQEGLIL